MSDTNKVYTDPETWDKNNQTWAEGRGYSYREYTDKGFGFFELGFPIYEKPETPIHPITGLSMPWSAGTIEEELKKPGLKKQIEHVEAGGEYKDLTKEDLENFFKEKELDPVGDKEWRDKAVKFIAEMTESFPTTEERLKAAMLVSMYMQLGLDNEIDNMIKYYEIKKAKPKRR